MTMLKLGNTVALPVPEPFDFTSAMRRLCEDICVRIQEFQHIRMPEVAVTFTRARRRVPYGLQAKLTPLRFYKGNLTTHRRGKKWTIQRWYAGDIEQLYILTFYLPRFQDQPFEEKMITIMHELYHISPAFDGDIRRLPGRYHVHSSSQKEFDRRMATLADQYLAGNSQSHLYGFLHFNHRQLIERFCRVIGMCVPVPKLFPVATSKHSRPKA